MAIENIEVLKPLSVWRFFSEICDIPRPSKHEEAILEYLKKFADERGLDHSSDEVGNIVIRKAATAGMESSPILVMQSHVDMVAEKEAGLEFNFLTDPIAAYVEDGWVKAKGTTLGADCGIGMAVMMAVLDSNEIAHPAIEALFTVDEETGLTGAFALSPDLLKGNNLINVDSEDRGQIFVGCAGGIDTVASYAFNRVATSHDGALKIVVSGLTGGHSGCDIEKLRANANITLARVLFAINKECNCSLVSISGGNLRNAIPRDAEATIALPLSMVARAKEIVAAMEADFKVEYSKSEPNLKVEAIDEAAVSEVIEDSVAESIVTSVLSAINGIVAMSQEMEGFVESSTNLASLKEIDGAIVISTSQRSSIESKKMFMSYQMAEHFKRFGATIRHSDGYPGWNPQLNSKLLEVAKTCHVNALGYEAEILAIHAGLECGLIKKKYPAMEIVSIGPTIHGAHSPVERLSVQDTEDFWVYLVEILKNL